MCWCDVSSPELDDVLPPDDVLSPDGAAEVVGDAVRKRLIVSMLPYQENSKEDEVDLPRQVMQGMGSCTPALSTENYPRKEIGC